MTLTPELEAFIGALEVDLPAPPFDWARARRVCQILHRAEVLANVVALFEREAAKAGVPGLNHED